jgi:hypothetical protein
MTNAKVDTGVEITSGRSPKLSYKGVSKTATVPAGVLLVTFAPAPRRPAAGQERFRGGDDGAAGGVCGQTRGGREDGVVPPT